jgi:anti-sigma regulatory factor (Ser/Thr protein kinase)
MTASPNDIRTGGCLVCPLPTDATAPSVARSQLKAALAQVRLNEELVYDFGVMATEAVTNGLQHALGGRERLERSIMDIPYPLEMWVYHRLRPEPQIVLKIFDPLNEWTPTQPGTDPADQLAEHGRGINILSQLSSAWGWHRTRSRLGPRPVPGKAVWCCIPVTALCEPPQHPQLPIHQAAEALRALLAARGIDRIICNHDHNRSLVSLPSGLTIWSERPGVFRWKDPDGDTHLQTTADLTDVTETVVRLHEDLHAAAQLNGGHDARTEPPCPPRKRIAKDGWMRFHLSHLPRATA